ncbi:MAG: hypothetical protein FWB91_09140 [Defluviitaleaceae bacterium]|nr:hypothetical protein [Defluviitaleaceae bacterium]
MLDDPRFDFSKETNIKSLLWEKMAQIAANNLSREKISFESLDNSVNNTAQQKAPAKSPLGNNTLSSIDRGKSK